MTEFMHHIVANREHIQADMDLFHAYQAMALSATQIVSDPWADAQTVVYPRSEDLGAS
jgi:hypothetical protein